MLAFLLLFASPVYEQAIKDLNAGRLAEAEAGLRKVVAIEPKSAEAWKALGVVYAMRDEHEHAEEPFANACKLDVREVDACYFYGRNQYALNRFERSIEALEKALPIDRQPARVHLGIAQAFEALGQPGKAQASFEAAIKATPRLKPEDDPRIAYSVFLFRLGKLTEARKFAEAAAAEHTSSSKALMQLARVLYQQGEVEGAVTKLERVVKLDPRSAAGHLLLGKAYSRQGKAELAQQHATLAEQLGLK